MVRTMGRPVEENIAAEVREALDRWHEDGVDEDEPGEVDDFGVADFEACVFDLAGDLYVISDLLAPTEYALAQAKELGRVDNDGLLDDIRDLVTIEATRTPHRVLTGYTSLGEAREDMLRLAATHVMETEAVHHLVGWGDDVVVLARSECWCIFRVSKDGSVQVAQVEGILDAVEYFHAEVVELANELEGERSEEFDRFKEAMAVAMWLRREATAALAEQTALTSATVLGELADMTTTMTATELARMLHTDRASLSRRLMQGALAIRLPRS